MIQTLQLKYFQAHKNSLLEFHPGINAICGQSDQGKSSVIRAIRLVAENRPSGDSYRSHFNLGKDTEVIMTMKEGTATRIKGDKKNSYLVGTEEYKAMGQKVPEEVTQLLNLRPVNTQYQMDSPFLVSLHSSKLSQYLNEEVHLDVIDRAISNIRKKILKNTSQLAIIEENQKTLKESLDKFKNLESIEGRVFAAENLTRSVKELKTKHSNLGSFLENIKENKKIIRNLRTALNPIHPKMEKVIKLSGEFNQQKIQKDPLGRLLESIRQNTENQIYLKKATSILLPIAETTPNMEKGLREQKDKSNQLSSIIIKITKQKQSIIKLKSLVESARDRYQEAIPETCPTCGQEWPENLDLPMSM